MESYQHRVERKTAPSDTVSKAENVCEICHKTKFTDGTGRECKYCKLKVCARCGVQVTIPGTKQVNTKLFERFLQREMCKRYYCYVRGHLQFLFILK